jgi:hypothetical protein
MTLKRARIIAGAVLIAILAMLLLARYLPTEVAADPVAGPPTIETHLASINSNLQFFKLAGGIISGLFFLLIGALGYAYRRDITRLDKKAQVGIDLSEKLDKKYDAKVDHIEENFMSIETHKMICHKH